MLVGLTIIAILVTCFIPPFGQDQSYHNFADKRVFLGIPNCLDVVSNIFFAYVGLLGIRISMAMGTSRLISESRLSYIIFFTGVGLTSIGSAYYHLAPDNARLVWDRLPMTVAFMSFLSATIAERVSPKAGKLLLFPLLTAGVASVLFWYWSELNGHGDLRFYLILVQAYPLLLVIVIVSLFRPRFSHGSFIIISILVYGVAKLAEVYDYRIFIFNNLLSGHTLKHIFAAVSLFLFAVMLKRRTPLNPS